MTSAPREDVLGAELGRDGAVGLGGRVAELVDHDVVDARGVEGLESAVLRVVAHAFASTRPAISQKL